MAAKISPELARQIERGIAFLSKGGLVAYPTDTVYGLGASAYLPQAVARVYQVKERPVNMPLSLLLADKAQVAELASLVTPLAWRLIDSFLPGALTLVLPRAASASAVAVGGRSIAIRIPDHPVPLALVRGVGTPIVGTSANLSGKPSLLTAAEVSAQLGDRIDFVIDGGRCPGGIESTVVDLRGEMPVILREGAIAREDLESACGDLLTREGVWFKN